MVYHPLANYGYGFEPTVWMARKTRHLLSMVHPKPIFNDEIVAQLPAAQVVFVGTHGLVSFRELVFMVDTEQEGIGSFPLKTHGLKPGK